MDLIDSVSLDRQVVVGDPLALPHPSAGMTGKPPCPLAIYMGPGEPNHNPNARVARALCTKPSLHHHQSENFKSRKIRVLFKMWQNIPNRKFTIKPLSGLHSVVYLHICVCVEVGKVQSFLI